MVIQRQLRVRPEVLTDDAGKIIILLFNTNS